MSGLRVYRAIVASVGLTACLVAIQVIVFPLWGVTFDGCTKYVPLDGIKTITRDVWMVWGISLLANLIVLILFLSDFLHRPRLLIGGPAMAAFLCLAVWKALAIAADVNSASRCGEARDFDYPVVWEWAGTGAVSFLAFTAWFAMTIVAVAALIFHKTNPTAEVH